MKVFGQCPACGKSYLLNGDGRLRSHGRKSKDDEGCAGEGAVPAAGGYSFHEDRTAL